MAEAGRDLHELRTQQRAFAAHLRDPAKNPPPDDIEARRMRVYSELFFNNMVRFLGGFFPVLVSVLGQHSWEALVRDFYRDHVSHTPLFPELPAEFLSYLELERASYSSDDPPYLYELAHYEWVEAALLLAPDSTHEKAVDPNGDPLDACPVLAEPAWLLSYQYPVHEIGPDNPTPDPASQPYYFLVFRNSADKIVFLHFNPVSARLFELLQSEPEHTGRDALKQVALELQHPDPDKVVADGQFLLQQWQEKGLITGTRR